MVQFQVETLCETESQFKMELVFFGGFIRI